MLGVLMAKSGKRQIICKSAMVGAMLVPRRVVAHLKKKPVTSFLTLSSFANMFPE